MQSHRTSCFCGQVELEWRGEPILTAACYCDDCQTAGHAIEALPGAPAVLDARGGTAYLMLRRDRLNVIKGEDKLTDIRIKPGSPSKRLVATCCNSAMYMGFDRGPHWVNVYANRLGADAPPLQVRVQTKYALKGPEFTDSIPSHLGYPLGLLGKLIGARVAMMFGP